MKTKTIEKYYCPFSDTCFYIKNIPAGEKYQSIEMKETGEPIFRDKEFKKQKYVCRVLENEISDCSWIELLNMAGLSMAMSFITLKNTNCIAYALKMTKKN